MEQIIRLLRSQAWERAKGELELILHSYIPANASDDEQKFKEFYNLLENFKKEVEDNGLQE